MTDRKSMAIQLIIDRHRVDVSDMTGADYRAVNRHGYWLAVTSLELATRIVDCRDRQSVQIAYIKEHVSTRYASDSGYLEEKASLMRALSTEIDVCSQMLRISVQGLKPNEEGNGS